MNLTELVKKSLAFGVGAAAFSAEKIKQFADEMVARGEMTSDEASRFVSDVSQRAEDEKQSLQEWMREQVSKMLKQAGAAEAEKVEHLERRIAVLEKKLGIVDKETEPAAASDTADEPVSPGAG